MSATPLDEAWLDANPLPDPGRASDKNSRGRVLAIGGGMACPGALALTAEAALRAGAGKVRIATVAPAALPLGIAMPEAGVIALPFDAGGEIAAEAGPALRKEAERCDALVLGPGMGEQASAARLMAALLAGPPEGMATLLDAAAVSCAGAHRGLLLRQGGRLVLTPHHGEMARLTGREEAEIAADPVAAATRAAETFRAVIVLKAGETVIAGPDGALLCYPGGGVGLATGGSGDVLAGVIGGLLARGCDPLRAAGWGVWLHGEAGRVLAERVGRVGFLARELPPLVPGLLTRS